MISRITQEFKNLFLKLPKEIQSIAKNKFKIWKEHPNHQSLRFKQIHSKKKIYSLRISIDYRALGVKAEDVIIWFWIGSHSDYEKIIKKL